MRKDRLTEKQALGVLSELVLTIAGGEEFDRKKVSGMARVGVRHDGFVARLAKQPGSNAWIVTGYEENPDGADAGRATSTPTQSVASLTRNGQGAGFAPIIAADAGDGIRFVCQDNLV